MHRAYVLSSSGASDVIASVESANADSSGPNTCPPLTVGSALENNLLMPVAPPTSRDMLSPVSYRWPRDVKGSAASVEKDVPADPRNDRDDADVLTEVEKLA